MGLELRPQKWVEGWEGEALAGGCGPGASCGCEGCRAWHGGERSWCWTLWF